MRVWITNVDRRSPFATINPIWAACLLRKFVPEKVVLIKNELVEENTAFAKHWIERIIEECGVKPVFEEQLASEDDLNAYATTLTRIIQGELKDNEVALDITPGRKFMSACMMSAGLKFKVARLYYLHLADYSYMDLPFVLIPFHLQRLKDVREL